MPISSRPSPSQSPVPRSGAVSTQTGDLHIPSSTRADGSLRKEIKIRPGYRPPEDVEVYKNRTAEGWKARGDGGVPGAEGYKKSGTNGEGRCAGAAGKNAKRREARKRAKAAGEDESCDNEVVANGPGTTSKVEEWTQFSQRESKAKCRPDESSVVKQPEPELDPDAEKEKQARNLKKKLRQARELREKKAQGENLLPEQFEKVIKIQELIRQLDSLGFDSDGSRKP